MKEITTKEKLQLTELGTHLLMAASHGDGHPRCAKFRALRQVLGHTN